MSLSLTTSERPLLFKTKSKWGLFSTKTAEDKYNLILNDSDLNLLILQLKNELNNKNNQINELQLKYDSLTKNKTENSSLIVQRKHALTIDTHLISDEGTERIPVATRGSILTTNILRGLIEQPLTSINILANKFIDAFKKPLENISYLQSKTFANDIIEMCYAICDILENEPRCHYLQSPVYVIGDIHGNLEDLHFFADNLWCLGIDLAAGSFLFLGDYVDRGMNCLECVAYLFALKVLSPAKITLLRYLHYYFNSNFY